MVAIRGLGDVAAIASARLPWRAINRDQEIVIEPSQGGEPVALYQGETSGIATHPSRCVRAGYMFNHVCIFTLEGSPRPAEAFPRGPFTSTPDSWHPNQSRGAAFLDVESKHETESTIPPMGDSAGLVGFAVGDIIDHFEVTETLGDREWWSIYRVWDAWNDRAAILRIPKSCEGSTADGAASVGIQRLFATEIAVLQALSGCEGVVELYSHGLHDGLPYLVTEQVGPSAQDVLARRGGGLDDVTSVLRLGANVAGALASIHARGIIHRDIKPSHILLHGENRRAKLCDFGLALAFVPAPSLDLAIPVWSDDMVNRVVGTLQFMSPEQARGEKLGPASDVYSFGLTLHCLLTGQNLRPTHADCGSSFMVRIFRDKLPSPEVPGATEEVNSLIARATAFDPSERFASGEELYQAIMRLILDS